MSTYKSDILVVYLLQAADKYYAHLRKLRHLKNEQVKATLAAAKDKTKKEDDNGKNNPKSSKNFDNNDGDKNDENKAKKTKATLKNASQQNLKVDFAENVKENEPIETDGVSCRL